MMKVGIDLTDVSRFENMGEKTKMRLFAKSEIAYCTARKNFAQHFAGHFAAKEAVMKVLGAGLDEIPFKDIEVCHNESGAPYVILSNIALARAKNLELDVERFEISISHTATQATAICLAEATSRK